MTDEPPTGPRRIRAIDLIEQLQRTIDALTSKSVEPYVSVDLTRNAKGETQLAVKVSAPGGTDAAALAELAETVHAQAVATYHTLTARYPAASGFVRNDGDQGAKS